MHECNDNCNEHDRIAVVVQAFATSSPLDEGTLLWRPDRSLLGKVAANHASFLLDVIMNIIILKKK